MTRKEYMEQLKKYLKRLPKEDYDNAIEYFSEYFDEAGPENERAALARRVSMFITATIAFCAVASS